MSSVSGYQRRKLLADLPALDDADALQAEILSYWTNVAKADDRRVMWLVERAVSSTAERLEETEQQLLVAAAMRKRTTSTSSLAAYSEQIDKLVDDRQKLIEDFRFLDAVLGLIRLRHMDLSAAGLRDFFRQQYGPPASELSKPG